MAGLRRLLAKRWDSATRTYYVGECHYHPAIIVEPSGDDLTQVYSVSGDPRYQCKEPLMLIVGDASGGDERPIRAFVFPQDEKHIELERKRDADID